MNPFLGVFFHWLGGLASGSFYVPYKGVKKWSWETYWLVGGFFSWIICPWALALFKTNDLFHVLHQQSGSTLWWTYFFGAMWGFGGLTFGLTMRYLGMSLGMGVALGYCAAFGTLLPPIFKLIIPTIPADETIMQIASTNPGKITLLGVFVCLAGIAVAAYAGLTKEREMPEAEKKKAIAEFSFSKGLLIATFSGIMSACFSFALTAGKPIGEASALAGTSTLWTGLPKLCVGLAGGFTTNFNWCVLLRLARAGRTRASRRHRQRRARARHCRRGNRLGEGFEDSCAQQLLLLRAGGNLLVLPVLFLHDGRNADGQIRFRFLDATHGQHHHIQHNVGLDFPRVEGLDQEGARAHRRGHCHAHSFHDRHRIWHLLEEHCQRTMSSMAQKVYLAVDLGTESRRVMGASGMARG